MSPWSKETCYRVRRFTLCIEVWQHRWIYWSCTHIIAYAGPRRPVLGSAGMERVQDMVEPLLPSPPPFWANLPSISSAPSLLFPSSEKPLHCLQRNVPLAAQVACLLSAGAQRQYCGLSTSTRLPYGTFTTPVIEAVRWLPALPGSGLDPKLVQGMRGRQEEQGMEEE